MQRARYTGLARFGKRTLEILLHTAIASEIGGDELRGFLLVDAKLRREAERRLPVDDAEIDRFSRAAMLGVLRHWPDAEYLRGGARVDVLSGAEGLDQHGVL